MSIQPEIIWNGTITTISTSTNEITIWITGTIKNKDHYHLALPVRIST